MCFQCQEEFLGNRVCELRMHWFTQQLLQLQCTPVLGLRMIDHLPGVGLLHTVKFWVGCIALTSRKWKV